MQDNINYPYITDFIRSFEKTRAGFLGEFEKTARLEGLPILKPEAARFLETLCALRKPKRILEIGAAIGFSALLMKNASPDIREIMTIDRYDFMIKRARPNLEKGDPEHIIKLLEGQASEILPTLTGKFDLIFLDAAKGQYPRFLPHCLRLLADDGVFITDNILCGGIVAGRPLEKRRDKTTVVRVNEFLNELNNNEELYTSILPVGDGMVMCVRKPKPIG